MHLAGFEWAIWGDMGLKSAVRFVFLSPISPPKTLRFFFQNPCISDEESSTTVGRSSTANGRYFERDAKTPQSAEAKGQATKNESIIIEEESTIDEGIGSSDKNVTIDLTAENNESETKTGTLDLAKKMMLKRLLLQKMAQQESSSDDSDESGGSDDSSSDEEMPDGAVLKRQNVFKKVLKRRNIDIQDLETENPAPVSFPQPKDAISSAETYKRLLTGESDDEDIENSEAVNIPAKRIKLPPPNPSLT